MANFKSWKKARNERFADDLEKQVPDDLLLSDDASLLNKWLKLYVAKTRKQDGSKYPPKTLYQLLAGLLRDMRSRNPNCSNFWIPTVTGLTNFTLVLTTCSESYLQVELALTAKVLKRLRKKKRSCGSKECWGLTFPGLCSGQHFFKWKELLFAGR